MEGEIIVVSQHGAKSVMPQNGIASIKPYAWHNNTKKDQYRIEVESNVEDKRADYDAERTTKWPFLVEYSQADCARSFHS